MSIADKIDALIENLNAARADAEKVDSGTAGTPGTRLRKVAQETKKTLDEIRKDVLAARG